MEQRREGIEAGVKRLLERGSEFGYVEGLVADIVRADIEYAAAVEAALEGRTDSVVVRSREELLSDIGRICELDGRIKFICSADCFKCVELCRRSKSCRKKRKFLYISKSVTDNAINKVPQAL